MYKIYVTDYIGWEIRNCGPDSAQKSALAADTNFRKTLTSSYNTDFAESQGLFNELHAGAESILAKGPSQEGMSAAEKASRNSQALNSAASANQHIQASIGQRAAVTGATPGVESGVVASQRASAAAAVENNLANEQGKITQQSYEIGRENYNNAVKEDLALPAATMNPVTAAAGDVVRAEGVEDEQVNQNAAASSSWMGLVGGLADAAVGGLTGGIGSGIGKRIGGGK